MKRNLAFLFFTFIWSIQTWSQCAMCRAVLESGDDQAAAEGINDGIIFLMAIPYILVALFGFILYKKFNKSSKSKNTPEVL
ncbi:hypothetical protein [Winogradskyella sp. KYW1333]|uniref:hypothetical protein n=1 Tax=unclassified Winogradskyella TaxID=2615021 RepID=UPI000DF1BE5A|nr:hypothetical protein [Winogradskyella sp. KYW1333]RCT55626.1 hypothetical protein DUZ96_02575 [Winogradskyella sp. KYW1333]